MDKDSALNFLNQYNFKYSEYGDLITVKLDFAQRVVLDFSKTHKLIITDKLTGWNLLTGFIEMNLKNAIIYNFVSGIITLFILIAIQAKNSGMNLIPIFMTFILWTLLFSGYYALKLENFKTQIMALYFAEKKSKNTLV